MPMDDYEPSLSELDDAIVEDTCHCKRCGMTCSVTDTYVFGSYAVCDDCTQDEIDELGTLVATLTALIERVEHAPDAAWAKEAIMALREPSILTEEGWEPYSALVSYLESDPEFEPLEVLLFDDAGNPRTLEPGDVVGQLRGFAGWIQRNGLGRIENGVMVFGNEPRAETPP
jgi:hypothetical protein